MENTERRREERRGSGFSKNQKLNEFIHNFWMRYFHDRPDLNRRKQKDRRKPDSLWNKLLSVFR